MKPSVKAASALAIGGMLVVAASVLRQTPVNATTPNSQGDGMRTVVDLCKLANCPSYVGPHIDAVTSWATFIPVADAIAPGALVMVTGKNFGNSPGSLRLAGLKDFTLGEVLPFVNVTVKPNEWHDSIIVGTIPLSVKSGKNADAIAWDLTSGLMDQTVQMSVSTTGPKPKYSNPHPVTFRAVRDLRALPACDVPHFPVEGVQLPAGFICGTGADYDACNGWHDPADSVPWYMGTGGCDKATTTIGGYHEDNWCCQLSPDEDTDTFPLALKNGWVFDDWNFVAKRSSDDVPLPDVVAFPKGGATAATVQIHWKTNANDWVAYSAQVSMTGPRGVPWK